MMIAFVGLGALGHPMAGRLAKAGHALVVHDQVAARAEEWADIYDGHRAATAAAAAMGAEAVVTRLGDEDALAATLLGHEGALAAMHPGALLIGHDATSAALARRIAAAAEARGVLVVDAPIEGDRAAAETGRLSAIVGGCEAAAMAAWPLIECYATRIVHAGGAGAGQLARMAAAIATAATLQGVAEALAFTRASGLDPARILTAIADGPAASRQLARGWPAMAGDAIADDLPVVAMRRTLAAALAEAGRPLPVTTLVEGWCAELAATGDRGRDLTSLIRRLTP